MATHLRIDAGDGTVTLVLISYWDSLAAARAYAGEACGRAASYAGDERFGLRPALEVRHFEAAGHDRRDFFGSLGAQA